jgi:hypothetical protein
MPVFLAKRVTQSKFVNARESARALVPRTTATSQSTQNAATKKQEEGVLTPSRLARWKRQNINIVHAKVLVWLEVRAQEVVPRITVTFLQLVSAATRKQEAGVLTPLMLARKYRTIVHAKVLVWLEVRAQEVVPRIIAMWTPFPLVPIKKQEAGVLTPLMLASPNDTRNQPTTASAKLRVTAGVAMLMVTLFVPTKKQEERVLTPSKPVRVSESHQAGLVVSGEHRRITLALVEAPVNDDVVVQCLHRGWKQNNATGITVGPFP